MCRLLLHLRLLPLKGLFDLIFLLVWFLVLVSMVSIDPNWNVPFGAYHLNKATLENISLGMAKIVGLLIGCIILISFNANRQMIIMGIKKILRVFFLLSQNVQEKIETFFCLPLIKITNNLAASFSLIKSPFRLILCLGLSFIIGLLYAFSYYVLARGFPDFQLSFFELAAIGVIVAFLIALPSVSGFWGLWEAGGVFAMGLFGVSQKDALGYTLINHVVQIFPIMIVGLISAVLKHIQSANYC
jgi:glycosyltransferase 2 family protein